MWNVSYSRKGSDVIVGQEKKLEDAILIAQDRADLCNVVVYVHKSGGHYRVVHPKGKEVKCTTL